MPNYYWGIDSAQQATEDLYQCVINNFSYPNYWGRYLTTVPGASDGLTNEEIAFLQSKGVKIMPIYNNFRESIGYRNGQIAASNAIFNARRLGIPKGVVIFANVERFFEVDADWLIAWVETFYPSGYRSGFYHDPVEGNFNQAFCEAVKRSNLVKAQSILWSAEPDPGVTSLKNAPKFKPIKPDCKAIVWAWQYGRDSETCPIDTNLITKRLFNILW